MLSIKFLIVPNIYIITLAYEDTGIHTTVAINMLSQTLKSCKQYGWNAEIFRAIDGYNLDSNIWNQLNLVMPVRKNNSVGRFADKPGALGCFLSHFLLWNLCIELNQPVIILEDDVDIIDTLPEIKSDLDLLKLHKPRVKKEHETLGIWSPGAFAYWLSPSGARKLINFSKLNGPKYNDKMIGSKILNWDYLSTPIVKLRQRQGSSTNPEKYPYKS